MVRLFKRITESDTPDALPTIRNTSLTVDQIHQELMLRTPQNLIQAKYTDLEDEDIQAVWIYKAFQNSRDAVIDRQELIRSLDDLPERISLLQLYDHIDLLFQVQNGVADAVEGKGIPHEQVIREMREYVTGLKVEKQNDDQRKAGRDH